MATSSDAIRDLPPVQQFVGVAEKFCTLVENYEALTVYDLAAQAAEVLPALYAAGRALPEVALPEAQSEKPDAFYDSVPIKHTAALARQIGEKIGRYNAYWQVSDPIEDEQLMTCTLGEDLADMYGDLKRGLIALGKGTDHEAAEAAWHWRFSFGNHWGRHLVSALRALHYLLYDYLPSGESAR